MSALSFLDGGACAPGLYPHSEALVQTVRDHARGRAGAAAVAERRAEDRARLLAVQRESCLAPLAGGMLDWQDLFRPLVDACAGLGSGALVRFLDGNTFYRAVTIEGTPRLGAPLPAPPVPAPWVGTLPSPFAFAHAAAPAVCSLEHCHELQLEFANRDSRELGTRAEDRPGYADVLPLFRKPGSPGVGLGVVDVHTDEVEPAELVRDRILFATRVLEPERIEVNPDCGLRTRTWEVAYEKLARLVEGARLAEAELEGR